MTTYEHNDLHSRVEFSPISLHEHHYPSASVDKLYRILCTLTLSGLQPARNT